MSVQPVSAASSLPTDPLDSVQWQTMHRLYFDDAQVQFDSNVKVLAPDEAEDPLSVPIFVDASRLSHVKRIMVFADMNPIIKILEFVPHQADATIGFRVKLQQATPVRAAVLTEDGVWHLGGKWVSTAGGGCTAPSLGSERPDWLKRLGTVRGRSWPRSEGGSRLKLLVHHPMDTGLSPGIPAFYLETLKIDTINGGRLADLELYEPVSENPVFSFDVRTIEPIEVSGRDNSGTTISAIIE